MESLTKLETNPMGRWALLLPLLLTTCLACAPARKLTVASTAMLLENVAAASSKQGDLKLIREGMPSYLLLMDGMVEAWPENERLLLAAAQGYSSYASAFVEDEDPEYAKALFTRGRQYALQSLERRGFREPLRSSFESFEEELKGRTKRDVPYLFWAATCWGSWIRMNLDSMEAVAQLPRVEGMMRRVLELDEAYYYGGPHLFMGIWFASRPRVAGGDLNKARYHFLRAIELGQGRFFMAQVYLASYYARPALDKDLYLSTLQTVLERPVDVAPELTLLNTVAKKKAKELLDRAEENFE